MMGAKTDDRSPGARHLGRRFELEQSDRGVATERLQRRGCSDTIDLVH